jgi:hypothetical protein
MRYKVHLMLQKIHTPYIRIRWEYKSPRLSFCAEYIHTRNMYRLFNSIQNQTAITKFTVRSSSIRKKHKQNWASYFLKVTSADFLC